MSPGGKGQEGDLMKTKAKVKKGKFNFKLQLVFGLVMVD